MTFSTKPTLNQIFFIKYQAFFSGSESNRGANLYADIKKLWVQAAIKDAKADEDKFVVFVKELKLILPVNKRYFAMNYVRENLPIGARLLTWAEFAVSEPEQSQANLKAFKSSLKVMRTESFKNTSFVHMGAPARKNLLLKTMPSLLSSDSQIPANLAHERDALRNLLQSNKTDLFDPLEELIGFIQTIGGIIYGSLSSRTQHSYCIKQATVSHRLVEPLFLPWLKIGGFAPGQQNGVYFADDISVVDSVLTESTFYPDLKTPARRVYFSSEPDEQEMVAAFDNMDPRWRVNISDTSNADCYRQAMQLELGQEYPDEFDTRGKKPSLNALKQLCVQKRCCSDGKQGIKESFRLLVDAAHRLEICFKRPTQTKQTVVVKFHIEGVSYSRMHNQPLIRNQKFV
jgi:hypothetical protein